MRESHIDCAHTEDKYRPVHHPWVNNKPLPQQWTQVKECNIEKRQRPMAESVHMMNHIHRIDRSLVRLLQIYPHPVVTALEAERKLEGEG